MTQELIAPAVVLPPVARWREITGGVWFAFTAMMLAGVAPLILILTTPIAEDASNVWPLALVLAILTGLRFSWLVANGASHLYEVIFWLFCYVFLGLAPMVQMRKSDYPDTTPDLDRNLNFQTMGVIAFGIFAFMIGLMLAGRSRRTAGPRHIAVPAEHRLLLFSGVAALFTVLYIAKLGTGVLFADRQTRSLAESAAFSDPTIVAVVKALATLPLIICFTGLQQLRRRRKAAGRHGGTLALSLLMLALLAITVNPVSTPRYFAGTALLAVITSLGATATLNRSRTFALLLATALVLVFPYAAVDRTPDGGGIAQRGNPAVVLASADFDAFDQINNTILYTQQAGYRDGQQMLGAILFAVPRKVWAGKPTDTGPFIADFRGYQFRNLSAPLWAEFYIDGGWLLVFFGMLALGYGVRRLDLRADGTAKGGRSALAVVLPFYLILLLRGSLLQAMAGLSVLVVSGLFVSRSLPETPALAAPIQEAEAARG